jgi:hypothetical protein
MVIDRQEHAVRRRKVALALSEKALKDAKRLITIHSVKFAEEIGKSPQIGEKGDNSRREWTTRQNVGTWATYYGLDFISVLGYGKSFEMLTWEEN